MQKKNDKLNERIKLGFVHINKKIICTYLNVSIQIIPMPQIIQKGMVENKMRYVCFVIITEITGHFILQIAHFTTKCNPLIVPI